MLSLLAALGRQKGRALALLIVLGILTPPLGALLRPFVGVAIFALLTIAFLRIDLDRGRAFAAQPWVAGFATLWTALCIPVAMIALARASGLPDTSPGLMQALMLQALAAPVMAGPAFALLLGWNARLVLVLLVLGTALVPLTAPLVAGAFGVRLGLEPARLALNLAGLLAGAAVPGLFLRRIVPHTRMAEVDGVNMLVMFVFISAVMGDLGARLLADPLGVALATVLAFGVFWTLFAATRLVFALGGPDVARAVALTVSNRNMGLMVAATGAALPPDGWTYFAVVQFPIYLTPLMLTWLRKKP